MRVERRGSGTGGQLLRHEAELLRQARHPGVIELVDLIEDGASVVLVTAEPSGPRLANMRLSPEEVAGVTAVLATTLADLHDIGLSHGAVTAERVGIDDDGRPVLGGFDQARVLAGTPSRWPSTAEAAADTKALGHLAEALLGAQHSGRDGASMSLARVVAPLLTDGDRARSRVTARRLASEITSRIPEARLPATTPGVTETDEAGPDHDPDCSEAAHDPASHRPIATAHRPVAPFAMAATITIAIVVACHPRPGRTRPIPTKAAFGPVASRSTVRSTTATTVGATTVVPPHYVGDVVTIGLDRYRVGETTDVMAFGRWSCAWPMLVVGRPRTGQVWLFPRLPTTGQPVQAVEVGRIPGLAGVHAEPVGACDRLVIDSPGGSAVHLDLSTVG